jgi:hypothetical protein
MIKYQITLNSLEQNFFFENQLKTILVSPKNVRPTKNREWQRYQLVQNTSLRIEATFTRVCSASDLGPILRISLGSNFQTKLNQGQMQFY